MTVCLVVISDGRPCHAQALASAAANLPQFDQLVHIDDTMHELGFAGAIREAWDRVECDYVFHLEADFTFTAPVPVSGMIGVLADNPDLVQLVLKRQPWNAEETAAGGIVEQHPDDYTERCEDYQTWTEHRRFFSTNPCVYAKHWTHEGWPQVPRSEGIFTHRLLEDPDVRFGFWGGKFDAPLVHHIGERTGTGY